MAICNPTQKNLRQTGWRRTTVNSCAVFLGSILILTGCNTGSFTDGIRPQSNLQTSPQPSTTNSTAATNNQSAFAPQNEPAQQQAALTPIAPVTFLPVTGAPQSTVSNLAASIRQAAQNENVPIVVSADQGARYQVKGYFSALNEGNNTLLVYVWDVLDVNGNRVHRISGQERAGGSSGDPWASIDEDVISRVAKITMADLRSWMSTRS